MQGDEAKPNSEGRSSRSIADDLVGWIDTGVVPVGTFFPTERELTAQFGVSRTTVRRALALLVEGGFAEGIANRGVVARSGRRHATKIIAFIDGSTVVLGRLFAQMSAALLERGYSLLHIDSSVLGVADALEYAVEKGAEAAFVWSFEGFPDPERTNRIASRLPIVALDHSIWRCPTDIVELDNHRMSFELVCHLAQAGRKRIAVTGMYDMLDVTHERFNGYMHGCFESGLQPHANDYLFFHTSGMPDYDLETLSRRLDEDDRPDALLVLQDQFVPEVAELVLGKGLRVPEDVAIVAIGDDVSVRIGGRELTAAHCDWDDFARLAIDRMMARLREPQGPPLRLLARHEILVRGTSLHSAANPVGDHDSFVAHNQRMRPSTPASTATSRPLSHRRRGPLL
ncbi:MAG: GntR family transcriptional regulator [Armatimonadetes bacterium]|nr:GntR family transcriptional regulator [Armatimonadota bacterium]